jgi:hypothetical protein
MKPRDLLLAGITTLFGSTLFGATLQPPARFAVTNLCVQISSTCNPNLSNVKVNDGLSRIAGTFTQASGGSFTVATTADSRFGVLHSSASGVLTAHNIPVFASTNSFAQFTDIFQIDFAPLTGQTGLFEVDYRLTGDIHSSGSIISFGDVTATLNGVKQANLYTTSPSGLYTFPNFFTFTYGTPFNAIFIVGGYSGTWNLNSNGTISPIFTTLPGSGVMDLSDTFVLTGLHVFDSQMNPVTAATISSGSGTHYTQNGVVPEPSSWLLSISAIGCFLVVRVRRLA